MVALRSAHPHESDACEQCELPTTFPPMQPHQDTSKHRTISATRILESGIQVLVISIIGCVRSLILFSSLHIEPSNTLASDATSLFWKSAVRPEFHTSLLQSHLLLAVGWLARHEGRHITAG